MTELHNQRLNTIKHYIEKRMAGEKAVLADYFSDNGMVIDKDGKKYQGHDQILEYYKNSKSPAVNPKVSDITYNRDNETYQICLSLLFVNVATICFNFENNTTKLSKVQIS
jgi:plasmid rolling circle replication initiator protein Rep